MNYENIKDELQAGIIEKILMCIDSDDVGRIIEMLERLIIYNFGMDELAYTRRKWVRLIHEEIGSASSVSDIILLRYALSHIETGSVSLSGHE